jgi:hypothetical protein
VVELVLMVHQYIWISTAMKSTAAQCPPEDTLLRYSRISENVNINIRLGRWTEAGSSFVERKPKYEIPSPSTIRGV